MMMGWSWSALALAFVIVVVSGNYCVVDASMPCFEALTKCMPCVPFLKGKAPKPEPACCEGARAVVGGCTTPGDVKAMCECFKNAQARMKIDPEKAKQLPDLCHYTPLDCKDI